MFEAGRLDHTTPPLYMSHTLTFPDLVKFKTAMFMYKAYYCMLPANIQQHFVKKKKTYIGNNTSQQSIMNVTAMYLPMYGIRLWNSLHVDLTSMFV